MPNDLCAPNAAYVSGSTSLKAEAPWQTFEEMLQRLHVEGVYIHADQLAEFLLCHGLPVHLRYVPQRLQQKAAFVNQHYQGDMAQLIEEFEPFCQNPDRC